MSKTIFIIVTGKCNKKCDYCFYVQEPIRKTKDNWQPGKIKKILKEFKVEGFDEITFTGGEPLLKISSLLSVIEEAKKLGLKINLNTNGTLINNRTIESLKKTGISRLYLSYDYVDDKLINLLKNKSIPLSIIYVIKKSKLLEIQKVIALAEKLRAELILQPAYIPKTSGELYKDSFFKFDENDWEEFKRITKKWDKQNSKGKYLTLINSFYKKKNNTHPNNCHMGSNDIVIDSDGSVYPCFHRTDLKAGNIYINSLDDILMNIDQNAKNTIKAQCFGEQCISLFYS